MPFVYAPWRGPFRDLPREVPILVAISFTVALGFGIVAPAIPAFARQFGVSVASAASVISVFALLRVVGALPAGRLADRFGEPGVMTAGIAIVAVSSVLAGFSRSFAELMVLRGSGGLGSAMFSISAQALLLGRVPAGQRGRASGLYSGGFLLGGISGPAVGGLVAAWSLRAPFFIYGGLLVVPAVIAAATLRDSPQLAAMAGQTPARSPAALAHALRSRTYRAAASANLADGFAALGVRSAIVPLFVREMLHRSAVWTGIGFLLFAALNGVALLPGGRLADSLGRRPVIIAGCLISAGGLVILAVAPGLGPYLAALAISGLGSGLLDVAPSAMIGDILGRRAGTLVAFYQMAGDVGAVVGPVAAGFLVDTVSYAAAFALAAAVLGVAAVLAFFSPETRPPEATGLPLSCVVPFLEVPVMAEPGDEMAGDERGHVHLRASHADRERVVGVLKTAFVQGRLTKDEFDARLGHALASRTNAELASLTFDLPADPASTQPLRQPAREKPRIALTVTVTTLLTAGLWAGVLAAQPDSGAVAMLVFAFTFAWTGILLLTGSVVLESRKHKRSGGQLTPPPGRDGGGRALRLPASAAQFPSADHGQRAVRPPAAIVSLGPLWLSGGVLGRSRYLVAGVPTGFYRRGAGSASPGRAGPAPVAAAGGLAGLRG